MLIAIIVLGAFVGGWFVGKNMSDVKLKAISTEVANLEDKIKGAANVAYVDVMSAITFIKGKL